jgi:hypothetical protein
MPYAAAKARVSFPDLCARLHRHGFAIRHLSHFDKGFIGGGPPERHLQVVVMNSRNLAIEVSGKIGPPHYGEDLFYKLISQVELFGE